MRKQYDLAGKIWDEGKSLKKFDLIKIRQARKIIDSTNYEKMYGELKFYNCLIFTQNRKLNFLQNYFIYNR